MARECVHRFTLNRNQLRPTFVIIFYSSWSFSCRRVHTLQGHRGKSILSESVTEYSKVFRVLIFCIKNEF